MAMKKVPIGHWYDENLYKDCTGTRCSLIEKHGMNACYNCPYDDCKHTSTFIHKDEADFVSRLLDMKVGRPHSNEITEHLKRINSRG